MNFWPNANKQNGDSHKKSALMGILFGLQRHFLLKREFDIISDGEFSESNQSFEVAIAKCCNIMFHLIRRGRENLRLLTKESFAVQVDAARKTCVYQVVDELVKNHRANDQPDDSPGEGRMYERPESPYCPVKTLELYLSKLNPAPL